MYRCVFLAVYPAWWVSLLLPQGHVPHHQNISHVSAYYHCELWDSHTDSAETGMDGYQWQLYNVLVVCIPSSFNQSTLERVNVSVKATAAGTARGSGE